MKILVTFCDPSQRPAVIGQLVDFGGVRIHIDRIDEEEAAELEVGKIYIFKATLACMPVDGFRRAPTP